MVLLVDLDALLTAINRIFGTTLGAATEEELAYIALEVASELTESPIGLVAMNDAETRSGGVKGRNLPRS